MVLISTLIEYGWHEDKAMLFNYRITVQVLQCSFLSREWPFDDGAILHPQGRSLVAEEECGNIWEDWLPGLSWRIPTWVRWQRRQACLSSALVQFLVALEDPES